MSVYSPGTAADGPLELPDKTAKDVEDVYQGLQCTLSSKLKARDR